MPIVKLSKIPLPLPPNKNRKNWQTWVSRTSVWRCATCSRHLELSKFYAFCAQYLTTANHMYIFSASCANCTTNWENEISGTSVCRYLCHFCVKEVILKRKKIILCKGVQIEQVNWLWKQYKFIYSLSVPGCILIYELLRSWGIWTHKASPRI